MKPFYFNLLASLMLSIVFLSLARRAPSAENAAVLVPDVLVPAVPREFRAAWVASVSHIDWPSAKGLTVEQQKAELLAILDRAAQLHLNAVILQVRPAADALYQSQLEPWSEVLSGTMGQAPAPLYDPLAFAVEEAHQRGLELHAWFNPYRAAHPSSKSAAPDHITQTHPELVRAYGKGLVLDPGLKATQDHVIAVISDVVRRYDIDGVHIDDYFYPYKVKDEAAQVLDFPDAATYADYRGAGGALARDDWRRDNVNTLIRRLHEAIKAEKKWVKFGISPFGIWRPGNPAQIKGMDAFADIYADSRLWLQNGWLDYLTPQLYWRVEPPAQSYPVLLKWWTEQNVLQRHLWPGNFSSRWTPEEIVAQIKATRAQPGAGGNVHFSMRSLIKPDSPLSAALLNDVYAAPALVPASPWIDALAPASPKLRVDAGAAGATHIAWQPGDAEKPWLWIVQARQDGAWSTQILPGAQEAAQDFAAGANAPDLIAVSAVDRCGNQSAPAIAPIKWPN